MDTCARGLLIAARMLEDGRLKAIVDERYEGWNGDLGRRILDGSASMEELSEHVLAHSIDPAPRSGRQEMLESILHSYL